MADSAPPDVSICIPALRPRFLPDALRSALAQDFQGTTEVLVGDDSGGEGVADVVRRFGADRVRLLVNPRRGMPAANRELLVRAARGRWVKFLDDDDALLGHSVRLLVEFGEETGAGLVFHERSVVDEHLLRPKRQSLLPSGHVQTFGPADLSRSLALVLWNFVGEPSNVCVRRELLERLECPFGLVGHRFWILDDVALYLNLASLGSTATGIGTVGSLFRFHPTQTSGNAPRWSARWFEWEAVVRWAADRGLLEPEEATERLDFLHRSIDRRRLAQYPELVPFLAGGEAPDATGRFWTDDFDDALSRAARVIAERLASASSGSPVAN